MSLNMFLLQNHYLHHYFLQNHCHLHHYHNMNQLNDIKTDDKLVVEIRGVRYELNDSYIGVIAKYVRTIS